MRPSAIATSPSSHSRVNAREDPRAGDHEVGRGVAAGDGDQVRAAHRPTMLVGADGTRVSARPVAARSAATTAGVEEIVGGSPIPRRP